VLAIGSGTVGRTTEAKLLSLVARATCVKSGSVLFSVRAELVEALFCPLRGKVFPLEGKEGQPFDRLRANGSDLAQSALSSGSSLMSLGSVTTRR
jgi:hypothetical protein